MQAEIEIQCSWHVPCKRQNNITRILRDNVKCTFTVENKIAGNTLPCSRICHPNILGWKTSWDVSREAPDPEVSYSIEKLIKDWDEKRKEWLKHQSSFAAGAEDRVFVLTGSQQWSCKNPIGDHLLLRLFKNKVDYCRIHDYDVFYNNALLHPNMAVYWAKIPVVRATMMAHPEAEWIFWVDSDVVFTDMGFKPPLERYKSHNLVVDGWPNLIYEKKSWIGVNAGVFLI
ncbi:hypothetical protein ACSBR2_016844 [Camellia fascicularis]